MVLSAGGSIARLLGTLVSMNLLKRRSAEKAVMFQAPFVMDSGVIGVSHHYWWVGQPDVWIPFGSVFSTLEPIAVHPGQWNPRRLKWSCWLRNVGLAVMVFGSVLPVGFL